MPAQGEQRGRDPTLGHPDSHADSLGPSSLGTDNVEPGPQPGPQT